MAARVTMRDVAKASGVSQATVSFVLNEVSNQAISPQTRDRVKEAAHRLGYAPHGIARALREGSSRIVVLNIASSFEGGYSHSFIRGLDDELARNEHVLLVHHGVATPESQQRVLDAVIPRAILEFGDPYAVPGHELEDAGDGWQDGLAAHVAVQIGYLADRGHRDLVLAVPEEHSTLVEARLRFSRQVAARRGLREVGRVVVPHDRVDAAHALKDVVAAEPKVTAVAAFTDDIGLRVLAAAHDLGIPVPGRLAVMGYDATEHAALSTPVLTTLFIDAEAHGRRTARRALGLPYDDLRPASARVLPGQSV